MPVVRIFCSTVVSPDDCARVRALGMGVLFARVRALGMGVLFAATRSNFRPSRKVAAMLGPDVPICVDNGAFGAWNDGYWFDELAFLRILSDVRGAGMKPRWVVAPDLVARGAESLRFSLAWRDRMPDVPFALAVQNGMTHEMVEPYAGGFRAIFVGGDLEWKWTTAGMWCNLAHALGLECHIGRGGNVEDIQRAEALGADSVDSSNFNRASVGPDRCGAWGRIADARKAPEPSFLDHHGSVEVPA